MPSQHRRSWSVAGLGALVILNIVLIGLLVLRPAWVLDDQESASGPPTAAETPVKREPVALPTESATAGQESPAARLIVNADATTAWRVDVGQCDDPAAMERTTDGGETWEELAVDLAPVSRVRVLGLANLFVIGGGADCEPTYRSSASGGSDWLTNDRYLEGSWYLMPSDRSTMAAPAGEVAAPCEPVDLAAIDATDAAVLCTDGTLALTADGGASWDEKGADLDAVAIGVADDGYVLAGSYEDCEDGVAMARLTPDGVALDEPSCAPARDGAIAVSGAAGALWLWAGDQVYVSTDGGQSW